MKDTQIEKKNNLHGINCRMDEADNQPVIRHTKKKKNNPSEQQEEKRIPKNKHSVSRLWDNFKQPNILIIRVPDGEEKNQDIGNLFEKIMRENFPNLVKEIDMQVQEAQSPKQDRCKEVHSMTHIIKMPKVKDKDRILKAAREKQLVTYRGVPIRLSACLLYTSDAADECVNV